LSAPPISSAIVGQDALFLEEEIVVVAEEDSDEIVLVVEPVLVVDTSGKMETEVNAAAVQQQGELVQQQ